MSFKVLRICASCANKVKKGEGFLVLRLLTYTWRGKPTRGLFCWHHEPAKGKDQPPAALTMPDEYFLVKRLRLRKGE